MMMMRPFFSSLSSSSQLLKRREKKCVTSAQSSGIVNGQSEIIALERCRVERKQKKKPRAVHQGLLFLLELHGRAENISFSRFLGLVVVVLAFCYFKLLFFFSCCCCSV